MISDSNRPPGLRDRLAGAERRAGPHPAADVSADGIILDPFGRGTDDETVATLLRRCARSRPRPRPRVPNSPSIARSPPSTGRRPPRGWPTPRWAPAIAGSRSTSTAPARSPTSTCCPTATPAARPAGPDRRADVRGAPRAGTGWRWACAASRACASSLTGSRRRGGAGRGRRDRELRIPGVSATEQLRLPVDATRALRGADLSATGAHLPVRAPDRRRPVPARPRPRPPRDVHAAGRRRADDAPRVRGPGDPAVHRHRVGHALRPDPRRRAGPPRRLPRARSGRPRRAASTASHATAPRARSTAIPRTAWIADWSAGAPPWLSGDARSAVRVTALAARPPRPCRCAGPPRVRLLWPGGSTPPLPVSAAGVVDAAAAGAGADASGSRSSTRARRRATTAQRRAVGIAEIGGLGPPRRRWGRRPARTGASAARCGTVRVQVGAVDAAAAGRRQLGGAFDDGTPLSPAPAVPPVTLAAGPAAAGRGARAVRRRRSASVLAGPAAGRRGGGQRDRVINSGTAGRGSYDHVRVTVSAPVVAGARRGL